jgi:hypothetical protein
MRRHFIWAILLLGIMTEGCKKSCYTCNAFVLQPLKIDTYFVYGQMKYDTTGGEWISNWVFTSCQVDNRYVYGNVIIRPSFTPDTVIDCQLQNK